MKRLLSICLLLIVSKFSFTQVFPEWIATYGGNTQKSYSLNQMVTDKAGNSYIFGYEEEYSTNNYKGIVIKYNFYGQQQWIDTLNGFAYYGKIATDIAGNVYVLNRFDSTGYDYVLVKLNANGVFKWKAIYNGTGNGWDEPKSLTTDDSLNVYVTGASTGAGTGWDIATVKFDSLGQQKWAAIYNNSTNNNYPDYGYAIAVDAAHNVYITGSSYDTINGSLITIKYNALGNPIWTKRYLGGYGACGYFINILTDDYIYIGGIDGGTYGCDYLCIKYDTAGNQIWFAKYNAQDTLPWNGVETPRDMKIDKSGNVYFTGTQFTGNGVLDDFCTVKFSSEGVLKWAKSYNGGLGYDDAYSLAVDDNGNVYTFGTSYDSICFQDIFLTIKYDSTGFVHWIAKYFAAQTESNYATSLGLDSFNNVYVSGICSSQYFPHFVTLKYSYYTGINEDTEIGQFNIYPNPSFNYITIEVSQKSEIEIINIKGQIIKKLKTKDNITDIDISDFSNGVYIIRAQTEKGITTKKFIKE